MNHRIGSLDRGARSPRRRPRLQRRGLGLVALALSVLLLGACETLDDVGMADLFDSEAERRLMPSDAFAFAPEHMFATAYIYTFGFVWDEDPADTFEVGTGTSWRITSRYEGEETQVESERALLAREADGSSLWYLRVRIDSEDLDEPFEFEYEARLNPDHDVTEIAFRDPDTDEVEFREIPEGERDLYQEEEEQLATRDQDWEAWRAAADITRETTTVEAGTFDTERMTYEDTDEYTGEPYRYEVWHTDEVPDQYVQFEYQGLESDERSHGELISIRDDYQPRFFD